MGENQFGLSLTTKLAIVALTASVGALTACTKSADQASETAAGGTAAPVQTAKNSEQNATKPVDANQAPTAGTNDSRPSNAETQNKSGTEFPSVGAMGKEKETGSFPSTDKGAENAPPAQAQGTVQPSVMPKDRNGEVGSPTASRIDSKANAAPAGDQLDVSKYPYSARNQFRADMETRLSAVDQGVGALEASPNKTVSASSLQALKSKEQTVSKKLQDANSVPQAQWSQYKENFRTDVLALEKSYREMSTTRQ